MSKVTHHRRQQQRLGLGIVIILFFVTLLAFGGDVLKLQPFFTPTIPGYLKHPPSGQFACIDWNTIVKATTRIAGKGFPDSLQKLEGKQVMLCGYMYPTKKPDGSFDETPVDDILLTQQFLTHIPVGCCGVGCQSPVGVQMAAGNKIPLTDWPFRVYGTLKLDQKYYGSGMDVRIVDAIAVIGIAPPKFDLDTARN